MIRLWKLLALPFFLGIIFLGIYLYSYLGGYKPVEVKLSEQPEMSVIFKPHRGPYHEINNTIVAVEEWAKQNGLKCQDTFGEYLDDPKTTPEGKLKSLGGCLITADEKLPPLPEGFETKKIPGGIYAHATFDGSPAIGPWKVYPKLRDYISQQNLEASVGTLEIYRILNNQSMITNYLIRITKEAVK